MNRNLGFFTTYGIEYVYDYLGEKKIKQKIDELKNKPTMGMRLEEFTYGNSGYFSQKGILYIFTMLLDWFKEIQFSLFLYENSKKYNEMNYHDLGLLPLKWSEHLSQIEWMNKNRRITKEQYINYTSNPYWIDYHFFYLSFFKIIKDLSAKISIESNLIGNYKIEKNKLIGQVTLELKTRRKPLTGQYLLCRIMFHWYNLEKIDSNEIEDNYHFKKDNDTYKLIVCRKENKATIEFLQIDQTTKIHKENIMRFDENEIMEELIRNYIFNIEKISARFKLENIVLSNGQPMLNAVLFRISEYYQSKENIDRMNEVIDINDSYEDIWKHIGKSEDE